MDRLNYINSANAAYITSLYETYKNDPEAVDFGWQKFFEGFDFGKSSSTTPVASNPAKDEHF